MFSFVFEYLLRVTSFFFVFQVISRHLFADDHNEDLHEKPKYQRPSTPPFQRVVEVKEKGEMKKKDKSSNEKIMFDQSKYFFNIFVFNA